MQIDKGANMAVVIVIADQFSAKIVRKRGGSLSPAKRDRNDSSDVEGIHDRLCH